MRSSPDGVAAIPLASYTLKLMDMINHIAGSRECTLDEHSQLQRQAPLILDQFESCAEYR
jgi:hypothetical protein